MRSVVGKRKKWTYVTLHGNRSPGVALFSLRHSVLRAYCIIPIIQSIAQ